jgi:hypothetical protein
MAYVDQTGTAEQDKQNAQSPLNQPPTTGSAVGSGAGDKTPNQPSSSVAPAPFTNLGSYLAVNAPQIQGMAEKVSGQLGETYNTAKGAVDTGAQGVQSAINAGYAAPNQELVNQAATNPTEFAAKPENVSAFQAQYNDKYTGPASAEVTPDYTTAQGAVQNAVNEAANVGNYGGLQSYLTNNLETNPTQAISALDTALLNQSPEAIQTVNTAAQKFPDLNTYFANQIAAQNQNITDAQKAAAENAAAVQNQFTGEGGVLPTFNADIEKRLADAKAAGLSENQAAAQILADMSAGKGTPASISSLVPSTFSQEDILKNLGILKNTYGQDFDLSGYLTSLSPDAQFTQANIAKPEDYAKAAALKQLLGMDYTGLNPADIAQAGTAPKNLSTFDFTKAQTDASEAMRQRDQDTLDTYNVGYNGNDPKIIAMLQDVYQRNSGNLNNNQQLWLSRNPVKPGDSGTYNETTNPPATGESRTRVIGGEMKWWDGGNWVTAPQETKTEAQPDGSTRNWKFNYDTGKYEELPPTPAGKTPPGVIHMS